MGEWSYLEQLILDTNYFGTVRVADGSVQTVLSDSLPSDIALLTNLQRLELQDNFLRVSTDDLDFTYFQDMTNLCTCRQLLMHLVVSSDFTFYLTNFQPCLFFCGHPPPPKTTL
jgi:hypothetical protein